MSNVKKVGVVVAVAVVAGTAVGAALAEAIVVGLRRAGMIVTPTRSRSDG